MLFLGLSFALQAGPAYSLYRATLTATFSVTNVAPSVTSVQLQDNNGNPTDSMTPGNVYKVVVQASDDNGYTDITQVVVHIYQSGYDYSSNTPDERHYIKLVWDGNSWTATPSSSDITGTVIDSDASDMSGSGTSGTWTFVFTCPMLEHSDGSTVTGYEITVVVTDSDSQSDSDTLTGITVDPYRGAPYFVDDAKSTTISEISASGAPGEEKVVFHYVVEGNTKTLLYLKCYANCDATAKVYRDDLPSFLTGMYVDDDGTVDGDEVQLGDSANPTTVGSLSYSNQYQYVPVAFYADVAEQVQQQSDQVTIYGGAET